MDSPTDSEIIDRLGGTTEVARICQIKPPSVSEWRSSGIPPARRQFLALLNPAAFECEPQAPLSRNVERAEIRRLVDSRMSKRALRARFGYSSDAHLAKVLGLPVEQVEGWGETDTIPALPQVMKLLGHEPQPLPANDRPEDPDDNRIVPLEVA